MGTVKFTNGLLFFMPHFVIHVVLCFPSGECCFFCCCCSEYILYYIVGLLVCFSF